ncbi:potassium channel family protein [Shewanella frigidimarina]|uniref:Potassium channel domain-containing protein n=1 Tax=Shewanella frigidimarina TaxID=56812 RepID=A0A106C2L6_SHEFR|nr:potassium channel family protein [Shewanella frigidimarina]KVX03116.1 hypothetical protein AWJ07_00610 [Shewanella frigidimarina]
MDDSFDYDEFIKYLKEQINSSENQEINGFEALYDFYIDFPPEYLDENESEFFREEIDNLAQDSIDYIQNLLQERESSWLEIKGQKWKGRAEELNDNVNDNESSLAKVLTSSDKALLQYTANEIDNDRRKRLVNLYNNKVSSLGTDAEKYQITKLIVDKFTYLENEKDEHEIYFIMAGELGVKQNDKGCYRYFEKVAKQYRSKYEYELAAEYFNKAIDAAEKCHEDFNLILELVRSVRIQYELSANEEKAAEAYLKENEIKYRTCNSKRSKFVHCILKNTSDYCQNPYKVAKWSIIVVCVSTLIFSIFGIKGPCGEQSFWYENKEWFEVLWDSLYFSIITFTTLGYGDFSPNGIVSRVFAELLAISGLLLTSLFLVSLVRKYGR